MTSLTFGRYTCLNTPVHKLDPRNKILLSLLCTVGIFFKFTLWSTTLLFTAVYLVMLIVLMIISKVSFRGLLGSLKAMWFLIIFLFAIYILIPNPSFSGAVCFTIKDKPIYWEAIYQAIYIILRLFIMVALMMVLTSTTKPMDLTYSFEWYMTPLKVVKFPVHEVAMVLSIAIRFIPTLLDETNRIMKAQASRGVDFNKGRLSKRFKAITSLIIPLFISAISRSEELANAMEARGYDPKAKRTKYKHFKFHIIDAIAFIITVGMFVGIIILYVQDKNKQTLDLFKILFNVDLGW